VPRKPAAAPLAASTPKPGTLTRTLAPFAPLAIALLAGQAVSTHAVTPSAPQAMAATATPTPMLSAGKAVDWWFVFKFNSETLPGCGGGGVRSCPFGGTVQSYDRFGQQFAYASSVNQALQEGGGCLGDSTTDPVGATFDEVYQGHFFYVLWNDQFDGDPVNTQSAPAGHSKGMLAWDSDGNGMVMQVSTPSWPGSGSSQSPRASDGNSLGCVKDNDVLVSQHFFALKLDKDDVVDVLKALDNASVVTNPAKPELVNNGGPPDIQALAGGLGKLSHSKSVVKAALSSGVVLLSKPSDLQVPPWQMVSAMLGGEPLRVASWWTKPEIPTTTVTDTVGCWDSSLGKPGAVEIATSGTWSGKPIGLEGMAEPDGNHAKIGVSTGTHSYVIFGDMNQQGSLSGPNCKSSQNGRGGLFYVVDNSQLLSSVRDLVKGDTAPPGK
jgi:hypothetical protein